MIKAKPPSKPAKEVIKMDDEMCCNRPGEVVNENSKAKPGYSLMRCPKCFSGYYVERGD